MSLSPQVLLSNIAREQCIAKIKKLPIFIKNVQKYRAAVLVPLCVENGEVCLLYTLRSTNLKNHSGQVSFPGGMMDENETVFDTALRETEEEIGVPRKSIDVWDEMPWVQGRKKDLIVTPVVGLIRNFDMKSLQPNPDEVEEIFTVSMKDLCNKDNHAHFKFNGHMLPIFLSEKHKIWGLTGLVTHLFLQSFLPENEYKVEFDKKEFTFDELMPSKL